MQGIAPFGGDIAVLAYVPAAAPAAEAAADANGGGRPPAPEAHRPEVRFSCEEKAVEAFCALCVSACWL